MTIYLDLIFNVTMLVALSIVSGFIERRWARLTRTGMLLQGVLFGSAAVVGMLHPLNLGPGLIFDGRSIMVSLCALFFGPWAAVVAGGMAILCRIGIGGAGTIMGVLVVLSSGGIGLLGHFLFKPDSHPPSTGQLYFFGILVHIAMLAMALTLPEDVWLGVLAANWPTGDAALPTGDDSCRENSVGSGHCPSHPGGLATDKAASCHYPQIHW